MVLLVVGAVRSVNLGLLRLQRQGLLVRTSVKSAALYRWFFKGEEVPVVQLITSSPVFFLGFTLGYIVSHPHDSQVSPQSV